MAQRSPTPAALVSFARNIGLLLAYVAAGKLCLMLAVIHSSVSPVWMPTGIALAAVLLMGYEILPAIFLGAFVVNYTNDTALLPSLGIAAGNTLEALIGGWLVTRYADGKGVFSRPQSVLAFGLLAALISTAVSASIGVCSVTLAGTSSWSEFRPMWLTWWLGDAAGDLVVAPFLILWGTMPRPADSRLEWKKLLRVLISFAVIGMAVFGGLLPTGIRNHALWFLAAPILIWPAFQLTRIEAATSTLLLAAIAVWGTINGLGPFGRESSNESLLLLQLFLGVTGITALAVASTTHQRAAMERALSASETGLAHLAAIVEGSDDAIISMSLDGTITSFNPAAERVFGYRADEVVGKHVTILSPADRVSEFEATMSRLRRGERVETLDTVRRRKDGTPLRMSITVSEIRGPYGELIGASKISRDITEQRRVEARLRQSEERLREIAETVPSIFWAAAPDSTMTFVSDKWRQFTGDERAGHPEDPSRRLHPDDADLYHKTWAAARRDEAPFEIEVRFQSSTGDYRWFLLHAAPTRDLAGKLIEWYGAATDIHDRKVAEHEREQLLDSERTARAEAERANRVKDEFLAMISHELRTPLNAILGWAQLLRRKASIDPIHAVEVIERSAALQAQLINDLLDIGRIDAGKLPLQQAPFDLRQTVHAAIEALRPEAAVRELELSADLDPAEAWAEGDATRMQQAVWNLITNALKFTPRGGRVHISLHRDGGAAQVRVQDTGVGIRADVLPHVFERFEQGDSSTTRKVGGLGLGLAITKHIVEMHGGGVTAESAGEGRGATFVFSIPVTDPPGSGVENGLPRNIGGDTSTCLTGRRILVLDDDVEALEVMRHVLEECGATVITANSAARGFASYQSSPPDIVISDLSMPDRDGFEFMQDLREWESTRQVFTPAVAVTAFARAEDRQRSQAAGYQRHLTKPLQPSELISTIRELIEGRTAANWPAADSTSAADSANQAHVDHEHAPRILIVDDNAATADLMGRVLSLEGYNITVETTFSAAVNDLQNDSFDLLISDVRLADGDGLELMRRVPGRTKGIAVSGSTRQSDIQASQAAGFTQFLAKPVDPGHLVATVQSLLA